MSLDNILRALELAMQDKLSKINRAMSNNSEIQEILIRFFAEKEKHPALVSLIPIPELMHNYLSLTLEER